MKLLNFLRISSQGNKSVHEANGMSLDLGLDFPVTAYVWNASDDGNGSLPDCSGDPSAPVLRVVRNRFPGFQSFRYHAQAGALEELGKGRVRLGEFCFDSVSSGSGRPAGTAAAFCEPRQGDICRSTPCFQLCCPEWHVYDGEEGACVEVGRPTPPPVLYERQLAVGAIPVDGAASASLYRRSLTFNDIRYFHYGRGGGGPVMSGCAGHLVVAADQDGVILFEDGHLKVSGGPGNFTGEVGFDRFCLRHRLSDAGDFWLEFVVLPDDAACGAAPASLPSALAPSAPREAPPAWWRLAPRQRSDAISAGLLVSLVFYAVTFAAVTARGNGSLFHVMLRFLILSQFVFCLAYNCMHFFGPEFLGRHHGFCVALALLLQFSYISSSCWFAAMALNVFNTFRRIRATKAASSGGGRRRREGIHHPLFPRYLAVCLSVPCAFTAAAGMASGLLPDWMGAVRPDFGQERCFFGSDRLVSQFVYFSGICLVANVFTLVLYLVTTYKLFFGVWRTGMDGHTNLIRDSRRKYRMVSENIPYHYQT